jgi:hypothetical protein
MSSEWIKSGLGNLKVKDVVKEGREIVLLQTTETVESAIHVRFELQML